MREQTYANVDMKELQGRGVAPEWQPWGMTDVTAQTVVRAYRFALDPTPIQDRALRSHQGGARVAFNRMLSEVKTTLDARQWEKQLLGGALTDAQGWSLPALRRTWNQVKHDEFGWWRANSKEAYNTGLSQLADALDNWAQSRNGARTGQAMGFPRFRKKARPQSVKFTTGTMRVEDDRHHVTLPVIGRIKTHESTRKLARRLENGTARILSAIREARLAWPLARVVLLRGRPPGRPRSTAGTREASGPPHRRRRRRPRPRGRR